MPENNPIKKEDPNVEIDTSGPEVDVALPEEKVEDVVEQTTEAPKQEEVETKKEETKEEPKKSDQELEDYSKGVQARIAKLTRKMREAERREQAATEYAKAVEAKRVALEKRFEKTDADYLKKFESSIATGMEAAQKELAAAIESGDAQAQVGLVMAMGPQCYQDKDRFPEGPWCKEKDWVMFARYAGSRIKIEGGEMRLLNDDEVLATIESPEDILHEF